MAMPVAARRNYVNNVRQYYQSRSGSTTNSRRPIVGELDEDDSSEPDVPAQRPAIIAEVVKQIITPEPRRWVCFPALFSVTILGIRGALERTLLQCIHWCWEFHRQGPFRPHGKTREENRMRARRRTMLARKTKCAWSPRRKLKAGRHETQRSGTETAPSPADSGAHSIKPGISRFLCLVRLRFKQNGALGDQGVAVVAK